MEAEATAIADLAVAHQGLLTDIFGVVDVDTAIGRRACSGFLEHLGLVADGLGCDLADRSYREAFSSKYRQLFPDAKRHYRTDVLEACLGEMGAITLNGSSFPLGNQTVALGVALRRGWKQLGHFLRSWCRFTGVDPPEARQLLSCFDVLWARFERTYIMQVMVIEDEARADIYEAIDGDARLQRAEADRGLASPEAREARRDLASTLARLNSVANSRRKGRCDLCADVLEAAVDLVAGKGPAQAASRVLAQKVLNSFEAFRAYLRMASRCLDRLDPHLSCNRGLGDRLVEWEESWEIGNRFLNGPLKVCFDSVVASVAQAKKDEPAFEAMCEDCDAELFMALPRVIILSFLRSPRHHAALVCSLLPHTFSEATASGTQAPGPELQALIDAYDSLERWGADTRLPFLRRAITGNDDAVPLKLRNGVARFMRDLERWSLALQRQHPDDWNSCAAVIMGVLGGRSEERDTASGEFRL